MPERKNSYIKILDSAIAFFFVIFLLSLSNSIFVNQLGYYGALILILIKWSVTKENPFNKTGLELALIWFILAEVLSTIFSNEPSASFHNLLKRILLIPIIYTTIASIKDSERAKTFVKIYLGATLVTVIIYLYFSYQHYLNDLYGTTESGPSIFQYPITASEIISFTVIFLFAFLINEKTSLRNRMFLLAGFLLSLLALFSTYKRTGWMGAAFGILIILVLKKQWKILIGGALLIVVFLLTQKNISEVNLYSFENHKLTLTRTIETEGRAFDAVSYDDEIIVSDYNNGLAVYSDTSLLYKIDMPSAVVGFYHWRENYFVAALIDTRFILLQKEKDKYKALNEFLSPGYTFGYNFANNFLYIIDIDSGLTVFSDPSDLTKISRYPELNNYAFVFADSSYLILAEHGKGFNTYRLKNKLPSPEVIAGDSTELTYFYYSSPYIFSVGKSGMKIFEFSNDQFVFIQNIKELNNVFRIEKENDAFIAADYNGEIVILRMNSDGKFYINNKIETGYVPRSFSLNNNQLIATRLESKQSRLLGIFDPNHPSNANRIGFWQAGIKMFLDRPLFGLGDIDLAKYYKLYKKPYQKEIQGHLHNNFFHILATLGLFGLLAVVYLFFKVIKINLQIIRDLKNIPFASSYSLGALAAFCGFLISGLTELNFFDHEITTLIWFTFGLNVAFLKFAKRKPDPGN